MSSVLLLQKYANLVLAKDASAPPSEWPVKSTGRVMFACKSKGNEAIFRSLLETIVTKKPHSFCGAVLSPF